MLLLRAGNDIIHMLTLQIGKRQVLRIELKDWDGNKAWAEYDNFVVDSERKRYRLKSVGKYTGNAGLYGLKIYNRKSIKQYFGNSYSPTIVRWNLCGSIS